MPTSTKIEIFIFAMLMLFGGHLIFSGTTEKYKIKRKIKASSIKETFHLGGINAAEKYVRIRRIITMFLAVYGIYIMLYSIKKGIMFLLFVFILYLASSPVENFGKRRSLYKVGKDAYRNFRREGLKQELIGITIQLKNLIVSAPEKTYSTNYVLSRLIPYTKRTKSYFTDFSLLYSAGEKEEGIILFEDGFGFKQATDFITILLKIDELPANEFLPQIDVLLTSFWEENETYQEKKLERQTSLLFSLSSAEIMALILDFVVVVIMSTLMALSNI